MSDSSPSGRLCGACGMCCDGVLFHSVELQSGDYPRQLSALGLKIRRKKGVEFFLQPCSAHSPKNEESGACSCAIYMERPTRCRHFNCRQILAVEDGSASEAEAMDKIRIARLQVTQVNELIDRISESNPARSLAHRVANALTLPEGAERSALHDELHTAFQQLESFLAKEFRVAAGSAAQPSA